MNIVTCTLLCCDYVTYVPALKFPKSWLRILGYRQKIHHFFFPTNGALATNICRSYAPTYVFSFTHNAVVLSHFRCVHPENQMKIFWFLHFMNQNKCRLHKTWYELITRTKYCTTTTASNWFVTLYYKLLPAVRSSSKHGRRWSSLVLYSIFMVEKATNRAHLKKKKKKECINSIFYIFWHLDKPGMAARSSFSKHCQAIWDLTRLTSGV